MKKFILPGIIFLFFLILSSVYPSSIFALFGVGESENASGLDCDEVYRKEILSKEGPDLEKNQSYTVDKAILSKKDNDYCLLRLMSIEPGFEGDFENIVKISYVEDASDTSKFGESRGQKGEARTVLPLEHCVIEHTFIDHSGTYNAEQMVAMARSVGLAHEMGTLSTVLSFCGVTASADQKSQQVNTQQPQSDQTGQQTKPEEQNLKPNPITASAKAMNDWITETFGFFDPNKIEIVPSLSDQTLFRQSKITRKNEAEIFENSKNTKPESPYWVGYMHTETDRQPLIKYPNTNEFVPFGNMSDIQPGSTIKSGNNQIGIVDNRRKGSIHIESNSEVTIYDWKKDKALLNLQQGEVEVKEQGGNSNQGAGIQTDFFDLIIIGTHFWVSKDPKSKQAIVGVYEGKVQVKTKDGQKVTVSPNGDKPGVVVVAQKLSIAKLLLAGLVLIAVIVGAIFFLKRRGYKTFRAKKTR